MSAHRRAFVASSLQKRIEPSLRTGALSPGDRLPSTREIGKEFDVDARVVLAAYQSLADEGIVVLRPRSGVFIAPASAWSEERAPSAEYLTDALVSAVLRGFSLRRFTDDLRIAAFGSRVRAAVIAKTLDQAYGLSRELKVDYGLDALPVPLEQTTPGKDVAASVQRAHLIVTTTGLENKVTPLASRLRKPVVVADVRPPFVAEEWKELLRSGRAYLVAADPAFIELARSYLHRVIDLRNVRMLLVDRDDLSIIPPHAPTYVTEAARERLGKSRIPGRLITPPRLLPENCVRTLVSFIVKMNMSAPRS